MPKSKSAAKPRNWNDYPGWNRYYERLLAEDYSWERGAGSIGNQFSRFVDDSRKRSRASIWVPGCGISMLPKLLAACGFAVAATDVSSAAIEFQLGSRNSIDDFIRTSDLVVNPEATFLAEVHDFREPYGDDRFDVLINARAFQGLDNETKRQVARTHFRALKDGGIAYFDTINVQGIEQDNLESALVDAGFTIPFYEATCLYRKRLRDTGISYVSILGRPVIPGSGGSTDERVLKNREILFSIHNEYEEQLRVEQEEERRKLELPTVKLAYVIYSTG